MGLKEVLSLTDQQYIYGRDEYINPDSIFDPALLGTISWLKESAFRQRSKSNIVRDAATALSEHAFLKFLTEGLDFLTGAEFGHRMANGLRIAIGEDNRHEGQESVWGREMHEAWNHTLLSPHGHEHSRRIKYWIMAQLKEIPELRHSNSVMTMVKSMMLFPYFHDAAEVYREHKNLGVPLEEQVNVKQGHEFAAAAMMLALHKRYAKENGLRKQDAWRTMAFAAAMTLVHPAPDKFAQWREATGRVDKGISTEEFEERWQQGELDVLALTPNQIVSMALLLPVGLPESFVEEYREELAELLVNDDVLVKDLKEGDRQAFWLAAEVCVRADMLEMVAPYNESVFRTLSVQTSKVRPIYPEGIPPKVLLHQVFSEEGNVVGAVDSDLRRKLWEFENMTKFLPDGLIGKSEFMQGVNRDNTVLGVLAFRKIVEEVLNGEDSIVKDMYERRMNRVRHKAFRRSGRNVVERLVNEKITPKLFALTRNGSRNYATFLNRLIRERRGHFDTRPYARKLRQLRDEQRELLEILQAKRQPQVVDNALMVVDGVLSKLCVRYGITQGELKIYKHLVDRGLPSPFQPYRHADSIGDSPHVLCEPSEAAERVYRSVLAGSSAY